MPRGVIDRRVGRASTGCVVTDGDVADSMFLRATTGSVRWLSAAFTAPPRRPCRQGGRIRGLDPRGPRVGVAGCRHARNGVCPRCRFGR